MNPPGGYDVTSRLPENRSRPGSGRVLCFSPHPDDEVIGPGGALCLHRRQGDPVRVVVATDGTGGDPDGRFPAEGYADRRRDESRRGLARLGVEDVGFWGYPDSCVVREADLEALAARVAAAVGAFDAGIVYAPWEGETNSDHRALHAGVVRGLALCAFDGEALGYEVWTPMVPDLLLDITAVEQDKRDAIRCYASQLAYIDYARPIFGLHAHRSLQFQRGRGYCEAYRRLQCPKR